MKTNLLKIFALLFTFGLFLTSCDPDLTTPEVDDETLQDNALGERAVGDVFGMVNTGSANGKLTGSCPDYAWYPDGDSLIITFPEGGCTSNDGVTRSGVIKAYYTLVGGSSWHDAEVGSYVDIVFDNYKDDGGVLNGNIKIAYTSAGGGQPEFTMTATNMSRTSGGKSITWGSSNTYKWLEGSGTPLDRTDDVYLISGVTEGVARNGKNFTRVATKLKTSPDCKWFVSGTIVLTITDGDKDDIYTVKFTEGNCGEVTIVHKGLSITKVF